MSNRTEAHITTAPVIRPLTFAEVNQKPVTDWNAFLARAIDGSVTHGGDEHRRHISLAANWVTCACGSQCGIIPRRRVTPLGDGRTVGGSPLDEVLEHLGLTFFWHVLDGHWPSAVDTLRRIEARSADLIAALTQP